MDILTCCHIQKAQTNSWRFVGNCMAKCEKNGARGTQKKSLPSSGSPVTPARMAARISRLDSRATQQNPRRQSADCKTSSLAVLQFYPSESFLRLVIKACLPY